MPTPYKLTVKADVWSTNTDQKLQIMEQILMLFNPSLEIQTTDNFIDWTSLSVVDLTDIVFSSRTIPVGAESEIDIGSLTFETPIWISPPTKVKRLGVVTDVIMNVFDAAGEIDPGFYEGGTPATQEFVNVGGYGVLVYNNRVSLLRDINIVTDDDTGVGFTKTGPEVSWQIIFDQYPGKFRNDVSQIFLIQDNGNKVVGRLMHDPTNPDDTTTLYVNWDQDTFPTNTIIPSIYRTSGSLGSIDAVIDPQRFNPRPKLPNGTLGWPTTGTRYLILENIGDVDNVDGPDAWKSTTGVDFYATANDIIEWTGTAWSIVPRAWALNQNYLANTLLRYDNKFYKVLSDINSGNDAEVDNPASNPTYYEEVTVYLTNLRTGIQYKYADSMWSKSFEGEYSKGLWRLIF
jgi:hypothetical protein